MTNLVTGANGFVGAAVVRALVARGEPVRALVRPDSNTLNLENLPVEIVRGDITMADTLRSAAEGCATVFHVAADYRLWVPDPKPMYRTNVEGSLNVLEAAADVGSERMVYTSSVAVLGINPDRTPADEHTPVTLDDMIGTYKRSKYLAEQAVRTRADELDFPLITVNPSTPIGPGDYRPTPTGRIIVDAARGRMPAYVDTGLNIVHVDDVAEGHVLARDAGRRGERYILGGTDLGLKDILFMVARLSGRRPPFVRLPRAAVYPVAVAGEALARLGGWEPLVTRDELRMARKHMYFSSHKASSEIGYRWRPAETAIADAIGWFRAHGVIA
jgi:dihydroflavonol-4-reductase